MDRERELETIRRAQAGEPEAWEAILRKHSGAVYRWALQARRSGRDLDDAISIGQEILLRCVRLFDPDRGHRLVTLLWGSLRNGVPRAFRPGPIALPAYYAGAPLVCVQVDRPLADRLVQAKPAEVEGLDLQELLEQIPPRWAEALRRRLEGATWREIGEALGISHQGAQGLARKAVRDLRKMVGAADHSQAPL